MAVPHDKTAKSTVLKSRASVRITCMSTASSDLAHSLQRPIDVLMTSSRAREGNPVPATDLSSEVAINFQEDRMPAFHLENNQKLPRRQKSNIEKGGWKTSFFIFGNEICEKLATVGLRVNLVTYLVAQLHMHTAEAAKTITNFSGTSNLSPILGAFLADAYLGRFYTILIGSMLYLTGMILLTLEAVIKSLRPPQCSHSMFDVRHSGCKPASNFQMGYLYIVFAFLVIGSGGLRPCIAAFGADQFDQKGDKGSKQSSSFFNWYYFNLDAAQLLAVTFIVYVQDNVGWGWGFGIPSITMTISALAFVAGVKLYLHAPVKGSPLTGVAQVIVSAYRKRHLTVPDDPSLLYVAVDPRNKITISHTNQFRFLDKAATIAESDHLDKKYKLQFNPWRLCSVHQVEELKSIIRVMPVIFSNILFVTAHSQESTFMVQQARSMYRRVGRHFEIPAGSYLVFGYLTVMIFLPLYDRVLIPIARKYTGKERGITVLQRIGVGLFILVIGMLVAAGVEHRRRHRVLASGILQHAHAHLDMSAFWLVPQFCLLGLADVFVSVGNLELFYDQFPESMRSIGSALFAGSHALGSYASTFLVSLLQGGQRRDAHHHQGWFADDRTLGHLDYFYWLLAGLSIFNFLVFQICARWYIYKAAATDSNSDIAPHEAIDPHKLEIEAQSAI